MPSRPKEEQPVRSTEATQAATAAPDRKPETEEAEHRVR